MPTIVEKATLFFDLDGTLTDSAPGIVRGVNFGLASVGCEEVAEERIRAMIGTPLSSIYEKLVPCRCCGTVGIPWRS